MKVENSGRTSNFRGVIDLLSMESIRWEGKNGELVQRTQLKESDELYSKAEENRNKLIETIADLDESIMEKLVENQEIKLEDLKKAIRKITLELKGTPVMCGSSYKKKGVQPILDSVIGISSFKFFLLSFCFLLIV